MKHLHFDVELNGFYGAYWACAGGSDCAVITMIGDDPEDRLARSAVKWLCGCGVNVLTMSPAKKDYGHHNYPLERVETAISWLKANGNRKIGIAGASTTGTLALTAAAMFPDITLTIAMTPSDFVWQGFLQGKRDGCKEWPVEGESLFSYRGKPLPYMPFCYQHPDYWHCIAAESKRAGDMVNSRKLFDDSETAHPIEPEEYIPVENIRGKLLLIGAEDDALWDTAKYIRRMEKRLAEKPHECEIETMVYVHGTHFVFPEGMLKIMLPVGSGLFVKWAFHAARKYPKECRETRKDIEKRMCRVLAEWKGKSKMRWMGIPMAMWAVFAKSFQTQLTAVLGYDAATAKQITKSAKLKYKEIIAKLPEFEKADRFQLNIIGCAMLGAFVLCMPKRPDTEALTVYYENAQMTPLMQWFCRKSGKSKFTAKDIAAMKATAALKAADRNPYSWNMEFYEYPDGSGYEGRFTKCGICVLMKELGLYDLTPALCHLDYTMSEAGGVTNFVRQYTLASGGPYCDCGYKKKGK